MAVMLSNFKRNCTYMYNTPKNRNTTSLLAYPAKQRKKKEKAV